MWAASNLAVSLFSLSVHSYLTRLAHGILALQPYPGICSWPGVRAAVNWVSSLGSLQLELKVVGKVWLNNKSPVTKWFFVVVFGYCDGLWWGVWLGRGELARHTPHCHGAHACVLDRCLVLHQFCLSTLWGADSPWLSAGLSDHPCPSPLLALGVERRMQSWALLPGHRPPCVPGQALPTSPLASFISIHALGRMEPSPVCFVGFLKKNLFMSTSWLLPYLLI